MAKEKKKVPNLRFKGFTDDWEQRKLGEAAEIIGGGTPSTQISNYWNGDINWYTPAEISNFIYTRKSKRKISMEGLENSSARLLPVGTVLFTSRAGIGKTAILSKEGTTNQGFQSIVPNKKLLDSYFIFSLTNELKKYGETHGAGSTFIEISGRELAKAPLKLPALKEQKKIGGLLHQVDELIFLQQRKLDLLKQFKKGLLQKMFADKDSKQPILRFKGFHDDWEQRKLSKVKDVRDGTHDSPKYHEKGFPLITSKNLTPSGVDFSDASLIDEHDYQEINKRSLVEIHDILFGMIGTIGNPVIVKKSGFAIKNVALIKHGGNLSNYFLLNLLNSPIFAKYINKENAGGTQKFLSLSIIRNFRFLAPGSDEQNKIGNMFEQVDTFITLQQQKLAKYQSIKKSLLQQMFI